jgi:hypothetical protein
VDALAIHQLAELALELFARVAAAPLVILPGSPPLDWQLGVVRAKNLLPGS